MIELDVELHPEQVAELERTEPEIWFTGVRFRNARSPEHPEADWLERNNAVKRELVGDWVQRTVPGRRVLDAFCANGAFAFRAAMAGAHSVTGVDFDDGRIEAARLVASFLDGDAPSRLRFDQQDVYGIAERFPDPFDVTLALGGLYHVADPAFVLRQLRRVTRRWLILQTAHLIPVPGNWAHFRVRRRDGTDDGLSSMRAGSGVWYYTRRCLRELLAHGGFEVVEERTRYWRGRLASPWYAALARPTGAVA